MQGTKYTKPLAEHLLTKGRGTPLFARRFSPIVALQFILLCLLNPTILTAGQESFDSLPDGVVAVAGSLTNSEKPGRDHAPLPVDDDDRGHLNVTFSAATVAGKSPAGGKTIFFNDQFVLFQPPIRAPPLALAA